MEQDMERTQEHLPKPGEDRRPKQGKKRSRQPGAARRKEAQAKVPDKDVRITIHSSQIIGGTLLEGAELVTWGTYAYGKDRISFSYMESELTGLDGTRTIFHILPDEVVLSRSGSVNSQMIFHPGKLNNFLYDTAYGILQMGLDTRRLECALDEHGGSMEIEYELDFERNLVSRNTFKIHVEEQELKS